ncbi:DMT family transporter [Pontibacillus litoralis]|uniref:Transporter n=1 Tax=Pontibacillus litoralis JSM 072002 TaxID=1385512 RepID=A0A0A5G6M7_9BACI|nr:DMT family transporter [Pontibacillus litoralis]KGX87694.1 transporter [Pontibacillus litoralis JSM 072002]
MNVQVKFSLAMIIFGSIGFFSIHTNLPSIELVFVRCVSASLLLGVVLLIKRGKQGNAVAKKEYVFALLCGFFLVINWVFLFRSFERIPITVAISIYHLAPVLVLLLGGVIYRERIPFTATVAITLCFIGTLFVGGIHQQASLHDFFSSGVLWAFGAALFYALTSLTGKAIKEIDPVSTTFIQTTLGIFLLIPFIDISYFNGLTVENWTYILITGFVHTGFVFYLFFSSIRELKAATIAVLVFLDPAVAILLDVVLISYYPDMYQWLGIGLIFCGMAYALRR